jgi:hypothetical protein
MNERFRELAQLAVEDAAKYCQRPFDLSREENETFALSFAELIVKETMQVVANNVAWNSYLNAVEAVIEHFGVEE